MLELNIYSLNILLAFSVYALALISPGPVNLSIMNISMLHGRKVGFIFVLGVVTGSAVWAIIATFGLLELLKLYDDLFLTFIKILGGCYLLFMGFNAFKSVFARNKSISKLNYDAKFHYKLFLHGFLLNLTNPKTVLSWSAIISIGMESSAPNYIVHIIVLGCVIISLSIFLTYSIIFSNNTMIKLYKKNKNTINISLSIVFFYAGYVLLSSI